MIGNEGDPHVRRRCGQGSHRGPELGPQTLDRTLKRIPIERIDEMGSKN